MKTPPPGATCECGNRATIYRTAGNVWVCERCAKIEAARSLKGKAAQRAGSNRGERANLLYCSVNAACTRWLVARGLETGTFNP